MRWDLQLGIIRGMSGLEEPNNTELWIEPEPGVQLMAGRTDNYSTGMGPDVGADPGVEYSVMIITSADFKAHGQSCLGYGVPAVT